jgi:MFS family permease
MAQQGVDGDVPMLMTLRTWRGDGVALRRAPWVAVLYTATAGNLYIALSPIFWGGFSDYLHFPDKRIGDLMSGEFLGSTVATIAGFFYMHRRGLDLRRLVYAVMGIYILGNYLTPHLFDSPYWLMAVRALCGVCAGTSYLAAATAITGLGSPPRLVAMFYGAPFIAGAVFQPLMHPLFEHWGISRAFELIAVASLASVALYAFFPRFADNRHEVEGEVPSRIRSSVLVGILSGGLLLQYIANVGIWLYFERIGELSGHPAQMVGTIVGFGTGMALVGTWLSALLARRLRAVDGILWGTAAIILSSILFHYSSHLAVFAGSVALFNAMITFLTPFYFILLVRIYSPARAVVIGNICMALGFSCGPLLIRYTVHDSNFAEAINVTVILFATSAALVVLFQVLNQTRKR